MLNMLTSHHSATQVGCGVMAWASPKILHCNKAKPATL